MSEQAQQMKQSRNGCGQAAAHVDPERARERWNGLSSQPQRAAVAQRSLQEGMDSREGPLATLQRLANDSVRVRGAPHTLKGNKDRPQASGISSTLNSRRSLCGSASGILQMYSISDLFAAEEETETDGRLRLLSANITSEEQGPTPQAVERALELLRSLVDPSEKLTADELDLIRRYLSGEEYEEAEFLNNSTGKDDSRLFYYKESPFGLIVSTIEPGRLYLYKGSRGNKVTLRATLLEEEDEYDTVKKEINTKIKKPMSELFPRRPPPLTPLPDAQAASLMNTNLGEFASISPPKILLFPELHGTPQARDLFEWAKRSGYPVLTEGTVPPSDSVTNVDSPDLADALQRIANYQKMYMGVGRHGPLTLMEGRALKRDVEKIIPAYFSGLAREFNQFLIDPASEAAEHLKNQISLGFRNPHMAQGIETAIKTDGPYLGFFGAKHLADIAEFSSVRALLAEAGVQNVFVFPVTLGAVEEYKNYSLVNFVKGLLP